MRAARKEELRTYKKTPPNAARRNGGAGTEKRPVMPQGLVSIILRMIPRYSSKK
jgi:hypothetical protein